MNRVINFELNEERVVRKVCEFLDVPEPETHEESLKETIKKLCVARLCKAVGITGKYNHKSEFFDFFASIMGEALCEKLAIKLQIACDEIRLIRYEHINLVREFKRFLDEESVEEAFLDAFELADRFKYLIPKLKKV